MVVKFKTAKLANIKGFHESNNVGLGCLIFEKDKQTRTTSLVIGNVINAPTQSQLQKWLRNKHNIHIAMNTDVCIGTHDKVYYSANLIIGNNGNSLKELFSIGVDNYEITLEKSLFKALTYIK